MVIRHSGGRTITRHKQLRAKGSIFTLLKNAVRNLRIHPQHRLRLAPPSPEASERMDWARHQWHGETHYGSISNRIEVIIKLFIEFVSHVFGYGTLIFI